MVSVSHTIFKPLPFGTHSKVPLIKDSEQQMGGHGAKWLQYRGPELNVHHISCSLQPRLIFSHTKIKCSRLNKAQWLFWAVSKKLTERSFSFTVMPYMGIWPDSMTYVYAISPVQALLILHYSQNRTFQIFSQQSKWRAMMFHFWY